LGELQNVIDSKSPPLVGKGTLVNLAIVIFNNFFYERFQITLNTHLPKLKPKQMNYYLDALKNYAKFSGRSRRSAYWYFVLFNLIVSIVAAIIDNLLGTTIKLETPQGLMALPYGYVYFIYALFVVIPGLALSVRRLHDVGKSGWFILIALIPLVGAIWLLILFCTDSVPGANEYGPNPKGIGNFDEIDQIGSNLT
jgi:uncharacterized membrane protein YhaH (DUF805 family)